MVSEGSKKRTFGWIAGVALAATAVGVTGCSNDTDSAAEKEPAADRSAAADSEKGKKKDGPAASQPSEVRQATAEEAIATWVTAVIKDQPREACLVMAEPATDGAPARVGSPAMCDSDEPKVRQMKDNIGKFRTSFTPEPPTDDPKVNVAQAPAAGDKVVVPAAKVTVDGQPLDKIILSHSTGVEEGQMDVKVESSKIKNSWYVTNLDFQLG